MPLPNTSLEDAVSVAEQLRAGCRGAFAGWLELTASVGVAAFETGESEAALMGRADAALDASRAGGRNRVTVAEASVQDPGAGRLGRA